MWKSDRRIEDALAWVDTQFPFPGYISEGSRRGVEHVARELEQLLPPLPDVPRLLDIGCGPMDKTAVLQRLGFKCCALDDLADPWHLKGDNRERIAGFAAKAGIQFHLQVSGDSSVPFPTESFDVVSLMAVIEHLHASPREVLNVAGLYLKPGGLLCVTVPNAVNLRKRLHVMLGKTNYPPLDQVFVGTGEWRGHVREYTLAEAARVCFLAGYQVLSATTYEGLAYDKLRGPLLQAFHLVTRVFPTWRSQICVVAKKPDSWAPVGGEDMRRANGCSDHCDRAVYPKNGEPPCA